LTPVGKRKEKSCHLLVEFLLKAHKQRHRKQYVENKQAVWLRVVQELA
jgi:hypothetical protein